MRLADLRMEVDCACACAGCALVGCGCVFGACLALVSLACGCGGARAGLDADMGSDMSDEVGAMGCRCRKDGRPSAALGTTGTVKLPRLLDVAAAAAASAGRAGEE